VTLWTLCGAPASASQEVIRIGLILEYTGQAADVATQIDNGIKLYVGQRGDRVAGKRIEIIRRDVGGPAPEVAKRLAQELLTRERVDILAGFVFTPNALAVADVSAEARTFMVVMNAATAIVTTKSPYMVRVSLTLPQGAAPLGTWAAKNGVRTLYTMVSDYAPGHDAEAAIQRSFKLAGGEVVGSVRMPLASTDFSAFVQRAKDAAPDGIFAFVPGGAQPPALVRSIKERGIDPKKTSILGLGEITEDTALRAMGDAAQGVVTASHYGHELGSKVNREFVSAYNQAFRRNPDHFSVGGYDGMHLIYEVLRKTGGKVDGESLVSAAKGAAWESPRGPVSIDPDTREMTQNLYIRRVEKIDGVLRNVELETIRAVKAPPI
jgi:branched-chain amino acid transport system substrate-binding protein